jgi:hypothetical protein
MQEELMNGPTVSSKEDRKKQWLLFIFFTLLISFMLVYVPTFFWLVLPFQLTSFVKAMDWI